MKKIKDYKIMLFDLDNTILDFSKAERYSICKLARDYNITLSENDIKKYIEINEYYWKQSDSGKMKKSEILKARFEEFFNIFGIEVDGSDCDERYRTYLTDEVFLVEGAKEVLESLFTNHDLYIVSNGVKKTQDIRMEKAGITKYFKKVFLSDVVGFPKPDHKFFDYVKNNIDSFNNNDAVLIGDNLFTDIYGANRANIASVYFNFFDKVNNTGYNPDYEIKKITEILEK